MRILKVVMVSSTALAVVVSACILLWFSARPVKGTSTVSLMIHHGDTGARVAQRVDSLDLFPPAGSFVLLCKATGLDRRLKTGRYDFTSEHSRWQVYKTLRRGKPVSVKVSIPEGLPLERVISILTESTGADVDEFMRLSMDTSFIRSLGIDARSLEGYLFPETYMIPWGSAPGYTLATLTGELMGFLDQSRTGRMREIGFDVHELLTFASLIEAETREGDERSLISSVYHNRLAKEMLLQCDPTVVYALGGIDRPLLHKDLAVDSPYNTYKYAGLPPGPICSPGAASIIAALAPENTDYLYFVADGRGRHIFSETLNQHNAARKRVRSLSD